ncbi:Putative helicase, P-loop containing nucleoside triphosphate hydrolase, SNF2-like domain superfamily [Septoria linicola]|uniref:Helicase, P-loop containing nucleoside triphosphate hydrolase, SNF2-like domain superfamily n=1 Tax=Septoria linicola TaxID=215465 RepID=A0A9Q9ATM6_9PEZI|nr:Putative helicase, P-loop containing nucleoside triphosphate hydrolase, SNF2-like domain superfamily [Septoria linicola]
MTSDPWKWTALEVAQFFRNDAVSFVDDMPNGRLPDMELFAQNLENNDVCGAVLFDAVDPGFLRDDCGITSLGQRSAVIHCIRRLKAISAAYASNTEIPAPRTPLSVAATPAAVAGAEQEQPSPVPVLDNSNAKRAGETEVQDISGRKRRKLNLLPQLQAPAPPATFFNDAKLPVDKIFFGDTKLGQELRGSKLAKDITRNPASQLDTPEADESTMIPDDGSDLELEDTNFQFQAPDTLAGEASFVYKRLHHFLHLDAAESQSDSVREISRYGRDAIAVLPYDEKLLIGSKAQSALVFQMSDQGPGCIAKRENVAYLESGFDYDNMNLEGLPEGSNTGEWDFLATKHKSTAGDEVLPAYLQSEYEGSLATLEQEIDADEVEDAEEDGNEKERSLDAVIDAALEDMRSEWRAKVLPQREEKRAWTVWRNTRQSRTLRDGLIVGAQDLINRLEQRVQKFRKEMHREQWRSDKQIIEQCRTMDATVEDIEEQLWQIEVWQRKKEPHHVVRHGHRTHSGQTSANVGSQHLHTDAQDRFSVERDVTMEDVGEDDDFHSAHGDLEPQSQDLGQAEHEDACDEMSEHEDMGSLNDAGSATTGLPEYTDEEQDVMPLLPESDHSDFEPDLSSPSKETPSGRSRRSAPQHSDDEDASDSEPLISPGGFIKTARKVTKLKIGTPSRLRNGINNCEEPIEISSDSTPAKAKPVKKEKSNLKKKVWYSSNPENDTAREVASWDLDELVERLDRMRVLIKLLAEAGPEKRTAIHQKFKAVWRPKFAKEVRKELQALQKNYSGEDRDDAIVTSTKLFLAWKFCKPQHYLEDDSSGIPWEASLEDGGEQIAIFCSLLETYLNKPKLWTRPERSMGSSPPDSSAKQSGSVVIALSSDEEGEPPAGSPKKRKMKQIKLGANAEQSQAAAYHRQQRFKELQNAGSNSQELQAMIQSDPSKSTVVINPLASKDDGEEYICIDRKIANSLKDHQIRGIQFMWREITADGDDGGQGCILAHTMGLGKTVQTIATLVALNEAAQSTNPGVYQQVPDHLRPDDIHERQLRMLIILPAALVQNWRREIDKWASHVFTNIAAIESGRKPYEVVEVLKDWYRLGGVLFMTYALFQKYVNWRDVKEDALADLGAQLDRYLIEGPEIVVADEVHMLKNSNAKVTQAAKKLRTESRIGLTGTPMSNDVDEIYSLVSFAAPDYLGEKKWFNQQYSNPIAQGNRSDSTAYEVRRMLKKLAVLRNQIEPKVDRADIYVLRGSLKPKLEFVIMMPLTNMQRVVYKKYLKALSKDESNLNGTVSQTRIFAWLAALTLLMNHPLAFKRKLLEPPKAKSGAKSQKQRRESTPSVSDSGTKTPPAENDIDPDQLPDMDEAIQSLAFSEEIKQDMISGIDDELRPDHSKKMEMLCVILRLADACDDKVLVFSGSLPTLNYIEEMLRMKGLRCGRIDGNVPIPKRQPIIEAFHSGKTKIMLMSTKAGVGLNIQGANRVVILDFGFNPSHEEQAVGRAYRIGQQKPVFVYRLVIGGTFEDNIYDKQMFKTSLTQRVVDKKNPRRIALGKAGDWLYEPKETLQEDLNQWLGKDEAVLHKILKKQIRDGDRYTGPQIRKLTTIETLQEDAADAPLDEQERREVEEELAHSRNMRQMGKQSANAAAGLSGSQAAMPPPRAPPSTAPLGRPAKSGSAQATPAPGKLVLKLPIKSPQPHGLPNVGGSSRPTSSVPSMPAYPHGHPQQQAAKGARPASTNPRN